VRRRCGDAAATPRADIVNPFYYADARVFIYVARMYLAGTAMPRTSQSIPDSGRMEAVRPEFAAPRETAFYAGILRFPLAMPEKSGYSSFGCRANPAESVFNSNTPEKEIYDRWQSQ
jgi:hypothetical protein